MRFMDGKRTLARAGLVVALIGVEIYLARDLTSSAAVQGYTATQSYSIAPPRRAKIKQVHVELGATVRQGDVIAQLDTTEIENELEAANAERAYAAASMKAEAARLRFDSANLERRFATTKESANAELASAEATAHTAAAELAAIDAELVEQTDLVEKHLANAAVLNTLQLRRAALAKQVDAASSVLRVLRGNANAAAKRSDSVTSSDDDQLAPLQARLSAAELRIAQLTRERDGLALRAPADGVIDALPLHAGDLSAPELPLATLVAPDAMRVVACIPEARARALEPGLEADITSTFDKTHATGAIESVTGTIGPLPTRCQPPGSKVTLMGRVAIVALDEPMGGLPGQTQLVKISARRRPLDKQPKPPAPPQPSTRQGSSTPPAPAVVPGPEVPTALTVPSELLARSRFEPSGLVWIPALDRYVIVSDDTGLPKTDDHAPWLFTMSAAGVVDKQPLVVAGVDQLNDVESIAVDAAGGLWLMASQSESGKGKRPESRRRLAHVVIAKTGELRADKVIDFVTLLDAAPPALRASLGVLDSTTLDIEGMAYRDGALFLGLKAPTDTDGRAMIWKVAAPDKLLAGDLAGAQLSVWARVKLSVQADGRGVPAGIADMAFFDADTLAIAVTASGFNPQTQAGAIYTVKASGGDLTARHVRTFPGEKPEGLAVVPGGKALAVTFDRGKDAAQWVVIPADQLIK